MEIEMLYSLVTYGLIFASALQAYLVAWWMWRSWNITRNNRLMQEALEEIALPTDSMPGEAALHKRNVARDCLLRLGPGEMPKGKK